MSFVKFIGMMTLSFGFCALADAADVSIDVALSPAGGFKAETKKVNGSAQRTPDGVEAQNVIIDLKALTTGIALRDKHTKEHLMVDKYPQAKLIKATGKNGKGKAIIEVAGKQQEVDGTYTIEGNILKAKFPMNLPGLDIKNVRYMGVGVKDQVMVNVNIPLQAGSPRMPASVKKNGKK